MNATMHRSLTQFVRYLGRAGKVDVDMDIDDTSENVEGPLLIRIHPSSLSSPSEDGMLRSQQEEQRVIAAEAFEDNLIVLSDNLKVYQPEMKSEISGDSTLKRVQVTFHGNGRVNKEKEGSSTERRYQVPLIENFSFQAMRLAKLFEQAQICLEGSTN